MHCTHTEKRPSEDTARRWPFCKPKRGATRETKPANTLILDFQTPELWENAFLCLSEPVIFYGSPSRLIHSERWREQGRLARKLGIQGTVWWNWQPGKANGWKWNKPQQKPILSSQRSRKRKSRPLLKTKKIDFKKSGFTGCHVFPKLLSLEYTRTHCFWVSAFKMDWLK